MWNDESSLDTWICCTGIKKYNTKDYIGIYMYANQTQCQKGHAIRALFCCRRCKQQRRTWSSSRVLAGHYMVNQKYVIVLRNTIWCVYYWFVFRMVHAFTCAGILPSQYTHLSMFSGLGTVGCAYIRRGLLIHVWRLICQRLICCLPSVYRKLGYIELVERAAELNMRASVEEVQALPEYSTKGEVYACDC